MNLEPFWTQIDHGCWRNGPYEVKRCTYGKPPKRGAILFAPDQKPQIYSSVAHAKRAAIAKAEGR